MGQRTRFNSIFRLGVPLLVAVALQSSGAQATALVRAADARGLLDAAPTAADSAAIESQLMALVKARPRDAEAWHLLGRMRWARAAASRRGAFMSDKRVIGALMSADTALRLATQFQPDSARYWLALARFGLESGVGSVRFASAGHMQHAYDAAKRADDAVLLGESADEVGMAIWRRYELTAHRALTTDNQPVQLQTAGRFKRTDARAYLATFVKKIEPPTGDRDYASALQYFREAADAVPVSLVYARHLYMALCTAGDWESLLAAAKRRSARSPFDAQARLAQGLALHRLGRNREASAAFDSAGAIMDEQEHANLFRVDRLLAPGADVVTGKRGFDSLAMAGATPAHQRAMSAVFWQLNDPDSRTPDNESLLEFMSRVVESEIRWTDELQRLAGVDTDRGDIFIRYGPPGDVMTVSGTASVQQMQWDTNFVSAATVMTSTSQLGGTTLVWTYPSGDVFFFDMAPGFGTARTPLADQNFVRSYESVSPVQWTNIDVPTRVAGVPAQVTRFRGAGDSTDIVVAMQIPVRRLVADSATRLTDGLFGGSVLVDTRIVDGAARVVLRDTTVFRTTTESATSGTMRVVTARIGAGAAFVRAVADHTAPSSEQRRMANALVAVEGERATGFGLSDVLLTTASSAGDTGDPARWSDAHSAPSVGVYAAGEKVGLLWEIYALTDSSSASRYRVTIAVERTKRTGASGFALRVVDGVGALLGAGNSGSDKLAITFDRTRAARPVIVEQMTMDGLSAGEYRMRVEVLDLLSRKTVVREQRLLVER